MSYNVAAAGSPAGLPRGSTTAVTSGYMTTGWAEPVDLSVTHVYEGESISRQQERKNAVNHYLLKARMRK